MNLFGNQNWMKAYVLQILPLFAIVIYVLGFSYFIPYYYVYGINIVSYLTLPEILVMTLIPLIAIVLVSFIWYIIYFSLRCFGKEIISGEEESKHLKKNNTAKKSIDYYFTLSYWKNKTFIRIIRSIFIVCFVIIGRIINLIGLSWSDSKNDSGSSFERILHIFTNVIVINICFVIIMIYLCYHDFEIPPNFVIVSLIIGLYAIKVLTNRYKSFNDETQKKTLITLTMVTFPIVAFMVSYLGVNHAQYEIKNGTTNVSFEINTQKDYFSSNQGLSYIGDCSNAIFLYNALNETTIVVNRNSIININFIGRSHGRQNIETIERIFQKTIK